MSNSSGGGGGVGAILGGILGGAGQVNSILGTAMGLLAAYRALRAAWADANPGQAGPFLTDEQLIKLLSDDAAKGIVEVDQILAKYRTAADPPAGGSQQP
jgi:hypothetical protein